MRLTNRISKSEAARRLKVTCSSITGYIAKGMPTRKDGKVDWSRVKRWHHDNILGGQRARGRRPIAKGKHASNGSGDLASLAETRIQRERIRLRKEELELAQAEGALVNRLDVSARYNARVIQARNSLRRIPAILAQSIAIETDPAQCQKLMTEAIDHALQGLADEA
jgi:hypothetical protein